MKREETLDKAKENVTGHRVQDYGKPEQSFQVIAEYWNVYLSNIDHTVLTARDVATLMALFKIARVTVGAATDDSYVDAAGYIACAAELLEEEKTIVPDGKGGFTYAGEGGA